MRTLKGQLLEIAATEIQNLAWLAEQKYLEWDAIDFRGLDGDLASLKSLLIETREETLAFLDSRSDAEMEAEVAFPGPWFESLGLPAVPLHEALRSIASHEWYHTGQMAIYLCFRGEVLGE